MRILIIDDHPILRQGLKVLLSRELLGSSILECSKGTDAIVYLERETIDLIILDLGLPDVDGVDVLRAIHTVRPAIPVLIVSMHAEDQFAIRTLQLGASGYLTKETVAERLTDAIRSVVAGGKYVSRELSNKLASALTYSGDLPHHSLSGRELEVLKLLVQGKTVKQVGLELGVSCKTISTHRNHILRKLESGSTAELVRYALKAGLLGDFPRSLTALQSAS